MAAADAFSLATLPYGSVCTAPGSPPRLCTALGTDAVELGALAEQLPGVPRELIVAPNLDRLLAAEPAMWTRLRAALQQALAAGAPREACVPLADATYCMPFTVGDYVDFYSSLAHATNVGRIFRPEAEPLLPNWRRLPVGYHGRSSTVVVSGTPIRRPVGQRLGPDGPSFGPSGRLDFELELGFVTGGAANPLGEPVAIERAADRIFGFVLVNDWSARDLQSFESRPLGPFLAKSFATSISPWVVPLAALERYRVPSLPQEPEPFAYLRSEEPWSLDIDLEVILRPATGEPRRIVGVNARELYWTAAQQLAHVSSGGAIVRPGDLYASGTISGSGPAAQGCLLELTWNGTRPLVWNGVSRTFLEDGDTVTFTAVSGAAEPARRIDFGEVSGTVLPSHGASDAELRGDFA